MNPLSFYIHVPFCVRRCGYCSFVSGIQPTGAAMDGYAELLCSELRLRAASGHGAGRPARTIYFGGGTPSLLGGKRIKTILQTISSLYAVDPGAEITVEANPGAAEDDEALCGELVAAGANRLSVGVQSFSDAELKMLGRAHDADTAEKFFKSAKAAGFLSVSLDLIYGLPGQTEAGWRHNLERAAALKPDHISLYCLELDSGTPLAAAVCENRLRKPDADLQESMYRTANMFLRDEGYERYEISNWSLPGMRSRHNMTYWAGGDYIAAGVGASGHMDQTRCMNETDMEIYKRILLRGALPVASSERLSGKRRIRELAVMRLRTTDGLMISDFESMFEDREIVDLKTVLDELAAEGWIEKHNESYSLSEKALFISDSVFSRIVD